MCALVLAAAAACTTATPGADSSAAAPPPAADSAVADTPAVPADAPADAPPPAPDMPAPSTAPAETTPARPGLRPRPPRPVPQPMPPREGVEQDDLDRLRREVRALARAEGCAAADQCKALPIGARPCGGPEAYVVYCPRTTDVAALQRKAAELERAQKAFNATQGLMSTCEYRMPPKVALAGGSCRAATSADGRDVPAVPVP